MIEMKKAQAANNA